MRWLLRFFKSQITQSPTMSIRIISAGAGSGKTYRLTAELVELLRGGMRPSGIIATTFTKKAAAELQERVRIKLLEYGMHEEAEELTNALIGTVHGLGVKLLQRFAYEAGVSPNVAIMADEDQQLLFNQSLAVVLTEEKVTLMEDLCDKLGLHKRGHYDWRREVRQLAEIARTNNFSEDVLDYSNQQSFTTFTEFLDVPDDRSQKEWHAQLLERLSETIDVLTNNEDETKKTRDLVYELKQLKGQCEVRGYLLWHQWLKMGKAQPGVKSKADYAPLKAFAEGHLGNQAFHTDIRMFIAQVFSLAKQSIQEFTAYKKERGLIDYTDMEVLVNQILDHERVKSILQEELDVLMVDEFQDTSPIQLEIFIKLSQLAGQSIWVGDPKQSIYGFRGAEPALMQAVIAESGGVRPEDIQTFSWRSREDIVHSVNALFTKAFHAIPKDQVALKPKRTKLGHPESINQEDEPAEMTPAIQDWHFEYVGENKRTPAKSWLDQCLANALKTVLDGEVIIYPKGESTYRKAVPGDVAILCRTNSECLSMAEALNQVGLKTAIARNGLLDTSEAKLVLACLKYLLNRSDTLAIAELFILAAGQNLNEVVKDRLDFLEKEPGTLKWGEDQAIIRELDELRMVSSDMASAELLNLLLESLQLRRLVVTWGNANQRLANIEAMRQLAQQYQENCNRLHLSSSLAGLIIWLDRLGKNEKDAQGFGANPDAVNILTYHRSKGLEWPVVICHSLEGKLRSNTFGFTLVNEQNQIDFNNILGNRWLRYWINPYGDRIIAKSKLEQRLQESHWFKDAQAEALGEEGRLLYVGLTRARDYLIFPARKVPTRWLNRVWHQGKDDLPTLDSDTNESPWEWNDQWILKDTRSFKFGNDFEVFESSQAPFAYYEEPRGKVDYAPAQIDLRKESKLIENLTIDSVHRTFNYFSNGSLPLGVDVYQLAKALKAFLIADTLKNEMEVRTMMAQRLIERNELGDFVFPEEWMKQSEQFQSLLKKQFKPYKIYKKQTLRFKYEGRQFKTVVDWLLESESQLIVIQNSSYNGDAKNRKRKIDELGSWFYLTALGLSNQFPGKDIRSYLHFVLGGALVEVKPVIKPVVVQ